MLKEGALKSPDKKKRCHCWHLSTFHPGKQRTKNQEITLPLEKKQLKTLIN